MSEVLCIHVDGHIRPLPLTPQCTSVTKTGYLTKSLIFEQRIAHADSGVCPKTRVEWYFRADIGQGALVDDFQPVASYDM